MANVTVTDKKINENENTITPAVKEMLNETVYFLVFLQYLVVIDFSFRYYYLSHSVQNYFLFTI